MAPSCLCGTGDVDDEREEAVDGLERERDDENDDEEEEEGEAGIVV